MTKLPYDANCKRCALHRIPAASGLHVCVPGTGPVPSDIMLVGEAPGADEERGGIPFVGQAGKLLDQCLIDAGLPRSQVFIDNTVRCRPPNNRTPTAVEQMQCLYYSVRALQTVKPKVIVCLGAAALKAMTGRSGIAEARGKSLRLKPEYRYDCIVISTYHPAASLHNPAQKQRILGQITDDLKFAARFVMGGTSGQMVSGFNQAEARDALRELAHCDQLVADCEWEVLKHEGRWPWSRRDGRSPTLVTVGIGGRTSSGLLAVSIPIGEGLTTLEGGCKKVLAHIPTTYHNATADLIWLFANGFRPILGGDTMVLASLLNVDSGLSLEALTSLLTDADPGWKLAKEEGGVGTRPETADVWSTHLEYNAGDLLGTQLLKEALEEKAETEGRHQVLTFYREAILPAIVALSRASLAGVPLNAALLTKAEVNARRRIIQLIHHVANLLNVTNRIEEVILNDNNLGHVLEQQGIDLPRTPKTNKPSIKIPDLIPRKDEHAAIAPLILLRQAQKLHGSYLLPWKWMLEQQGDGRLHTVYKLTTARTGRSSAENERGGTLQQFPRGSSMRKLVRALLGWQIISPDYSQIELRIAAWLANEVTMIRFFNEGVDAHYATAWWIKNVNSGITLQQYRDTITRFTVDDWKREVSKEERQSAKAVNFGLLFGGTEATLQRTALKDYGVRMSFEQAEAARQGWTKLYEGFIPWWESAHRILELGYVDTAFGRRRYIGREEQYDEAERIRRAINTPVQATASDLSLFALGQADARLIEAGYGDTIEPIGFIHDNNMFHGDKQYHDAHSEIIRDAMEHPPLHRLNIEIPIPLEVEIKYGDTWS